MGVMSRGTKQNTRLLLPSRQGFTRTAEVNGLLCGVYRAESSGERSRLSRRVSDFGLRNGRGTDPANTHERDRRFHTRGSRIASSTVASMPATPTVAAIALQVWNVSASVRTPIFDTIQKPLSFIQEPIIDPLPIAVAR